MCYGKLESALIFGTVPLLLLGHLSTLMPTGVERGFGIVLAVLFTIFAARKYTQPVKDDIGDKSIFTFLKLDPEQQRAVMMQLQAGAAASDMTASGNLDDDN